MPYVEQMVPPEFLLARVDNESPKGFDFDWQCKLMKA